MPTVSDNAPGLMHSDEAVFTLSETACSDGQACRCLHFEVYKTGEGQLWRPNVGHVEKVARVLVE
jgi:hypothetical protein